MDPTTVVMEEPEDPAFTRRHRQFIKNGEWLTAQGAALFERYLGQYIAVSSGEVFSAADAQEARRRAKAAHPDDEPFVQYVPVEHAIRIYACRRSLAPL